MKTKIKCTCKKKNLFTMAKKCLPLNIPHVSEPLEGAGGQTDVSLAVAWALASSVPVPAPLPPAVVRSLQRACLGRWETDQCSTTVRVIRILNPPPHTHTDTQKRLFSSCSCSSPRGTKSRPPAFVDDNPFSCVNIAGDKNLSNEEHKPSDAVIVCCGSLFHNLFMIGTAYLTI